MPNADEATQRPHKRKWPRRVRAVVLCLIAGAIINVLVAWGCAAVQRPMRTTATVGEGYVQHGLLQRHWMSYRSFGNALFDGVRRWTSDFEQRQIHERGEVLSVWNPLRRQTSAFAASVQDSDARIVEEHRVIHASGWPWHSMYWDWFGVFTDSSLTVQGGGGQWAINVLQHGLPLKPFMPGFLYGMMLYTAALWGLTVGLRLWRQRLREKRGLCPSCKYVLWGVGYLSCPECGEPLSSVARQAALLNDPSNCTFHRRWPRVARTIAACFLAGAMLNILVAFGSVLMAQHAPDGWSTSHAKDGVAVVSALGWSRYFCNGIDIEMKGDGLPNWTRVDQLMSQDPPDLSFLVEVECGFPFRTFNGSASGSGFDPTTWSRRVGLICVDPINGSAYPFRPVWNGLVVNTLMYGVLVLLIRSISRTIMGRRNLCPSCAYDLRGAKHEVCPECGK